MLAQRGQPDRTFLIAATLGIFGWSLNARLPLEGTVTEGGHVGQ